ncbi:MAG: hypothetical protein KDC48_21745, partial [Planctomycetes bacterium]|nr:hypothetical protein [Planctomycetota bacterium]
TPPTRACGRRPRERGRLPVSIVARRSDGEWVIALDPATGRFRVEFPAGGRVPNGIEHWLMASLAMYLDEPEFRAGVITLALGRRREIGPYH